MTTTYQRDAVLGGVMSLLTEVKAASAKEAADANAEPGGTGSAAKDPGQQLGQSTHPSAKKDERVHPARPGARNSEHEKDLNKAWPANNVQVAKDNTDSTDHGINQIGTKKTTTGEDPASEDRYKSDKEDPGTSHPANANAVGEKYSSWGFDETYTEACSLMNDVLAQCVGETPAAPAKSAADQAAQAGYALAQAAAQVPEADVKKAAQAMVVESFHRDAELDADLVGRWLHKTAAAAGRQAQPKQATALPDPPPGPVAPPEMGGAAGGPGGGGGDPSAGGGDAGAGLPIGPADAGGGGDPMAGGGAAGGDHEQAANELANAIIAAGIDPQQLLALLEAHMGGHGGAGGGMGGTSSEANGQGGENAPPDDGTKAAAVARLGGVDNLRLVKAGTESAVNLLKAGRFRYGPPANQKAADERKQAIEYVQMLREVLRG
jgi:hypothetical protein